MNQKKAHASQSSTLPSHSKSPPPKPKLVNKLAMPHRKNAQLPTKNIVHAAICAS